MLWAVSSFTGDTNSDTLLDTTETWTYTKSATAQAGHVTNTGIFSGSYSFHHAPLSFPTRRSSDLDSPSIKIVKFVNGDDANSAPGIHVAAGSSLTFTYVV